MCLLVLAWQAHSRYRLIVAANRDEYHDRPAEPLGSWPPPEDMLAGRDLRAGGTWLGVDRRRRFGVITNYRDLQGAPAEAPSRGGLIPRYLRQAAGAGEYLHSLEREAGGYGGFNLLLTDGSAIAATTAGDTLCYRQRPGGVLVASEPYDDDDDWEEVPPGSVLEATPAAVTIRPLPTTTR